MHLSSQAAKDATVPPPDNGVTLFSQPQLAVSMNTEEEFFLYLGLQTEHFVEAEAMVGTKSVLNTKA